MAKQQSLDYPAAMTILKEAKLWGGGARIDWVKVSKEKNGFPPAYKATHAVDVVRDGIRESPEGWKVDVYFHASANPELPPKISISFCAESARIIGIDHGRASSHLNQVVKGQAYSGQKVGHPHIHLPVPKLTEGYVEPLTEMTYDEYWTLFQAKIKMTEAPGMHKPMEEPKQGELL